MVLFIFNVITHVLCLDCKWGKTGNGRTVRILLLLLLETLVIEGMEESLESEGILKA